VAQSRTVVVGAGLAGLACAFDLARAGADVVVFERAPRPGGAVGTLHRSGFTFEIGPNTVPAKSPSFRSLALDLGLAERLIHTRDESATRWLWFQGRLVALPRSPLGLLTTPVLGARARLFLATEPLRRFVPPDGDVEPTFEQFLTERIGREATGVLAGAFVRGVYAAEIEELGARSAFPRLWSATVSRGGLVRGLLLGRKNHREESRFEGQRIPRTALVSFPSGMQAMVDALERELGRRVHVGVGVERVTRDGARWIVATSDGSATFADRVVIATQAPVAHNLLANVIDTSALAAIRHAEITVVHLGFARDVVLPRGFGYLVPPDESARGSIAPRALGTIFTSNVFAGRTPEGASSIASFYRTPRGRALEGSALDDGALVDLACDDLRLALGAATRPRPTLHHIQRWNDVIPRLEPGHDRRMSALIEDLREREPTLHLAGSYVGGVSVDAVIATGRRIAREVLLRERAGA
jgi:oxygen-dependent protoporphyrinogen oxidase